jgi:ABC-2 type transport system ATP-binding protein
VLELVELVDKADAKVRELSGGQLRRLDVGVALVGRPELVVLDEPTTGFDPAARRRAWRTIANLRDLGTSVLLTTHYMEEAQELSDRLAVMAAGRIVGAGTPAELARQLRLDPRLTFRMPEGLTLSELPPSVRGADVVDGLATLPCGRPTEVLADLCGWAVERGRSLEDLELRTPTLEESYLALTGGDA